MSHELRTPLNAILGFSQLMARDQAVTAEQKLSLGIINRSGEHLLNLINDVLEMSKIEAGKIVLHHKSFDLHQLLQTIQDMFQIKAEAKQLWFQFVLAEDLPQFVVGDAHKLRQLLINLLSNAVKFTQTGGVTLRTFICQSEELSAHQAQLCFEIKDTGKGIAPEELDKLFNPFVQTASGIQSEGGTGLGLSISRQFVELMGGTIQATSILGEGSTFTFNIQVELSKSSPTDISTANQRVQQIAPGQPNYRLMVVDDRESNRLALVKLLQSVGLETRTANNGIEAIALWQTWQPDLIWMDMRMPVMNGYEAASKIKSYPQGTKTIIIALTASVFEEQREKILATGCDDFVTKPFLEQVIFDKLSQHLGIQFIYQKEDSNLQANKTNKTKKVLVNADLSALPPKLVIQIHQAAIAVDAEKIEQLITQIPDSQQHLTMVITEMLANYDFDGIIELTEL